MTKTPPISPNPPRPIEILAFPGVNVLDVTGPLQVFASANELAVQRGHAPPYAPRVIAASRTIPCSAGLALFTEALPDMEAPLDTLIVPGGDGVDRAAEDEGLVTWLRARSSAARRTASICTGAFLTAAAGLLDARSAVTHWERCDELARRFPSVRVEMDPIFINDGPMWSSAGVTAGIDLCLALVEQDLGYEIALAIARDLLVYLKRPGGQAQYSAMVRLQGSNRFTELHDWIRENLRSDLSLARLASRCGMSERNLSRRYLEETGTTPARGVERLRIEAARTLLAETKLPVKRVAAECGFQNEETLRRSFIRLFSTSPQEYRRGWGSSEAP